MSTRKEKQAKKQAIQDIKEELHKESKVFIGYITELNPIMESLIADYEKERASYCTHHWSKKA